MLINAAVQRRRPPDDPLADAIEKLITSQPNLTWSGSLTELTDQLGLALDPSQLSKQPRPLIPALNARGITATALMLTNTPIPPLDSARDPVFIHGP